MGRPPSPAGAALWAPSLDRAASVPVSRQLAGALRRAVAEGRFGAGARLSSTRALAAQLGIARSTVVLVFEQLAAEGYIAARPGLGYFVQIPPSSSEPAGDAAAGPGAALLAWAEAAGAWIIEDDYVSEFQEPARVLPSLQGLDRAGRVVYLGTFSKLLFPSLRLGYAVLPEDLAAPFAAARHLADRHSSGLIQAMMTEFILGGHFARHLKRMRARYAERQGLLSGPLTRRRGRLLKIRPNECGMYLTAWLPPGWSDREAAEALAAAGVAALPLSALTLATRRRPGLVLGYTGHEEIAMTRAAERVAAVLDRKSRMANWRKSELLEDQLPQ